MKTHGTIDNFKGSWIVTCAPHVAIRLKRLFPRLAARGETICIADTLETSRELEWFCMRFPMAFKSPAVEGRLSDRARQHRDTEEQVEQVIAGIQKALPFRLALPPREYQKVAGTLIVTTPGILLGDDLGIGKSVSAICALTDPRTRPALVVTLTHLPKQWQREIKRFAPNLTTHIIQGTREYKIDEACGGKYPDVVITSYSKLAGWGSYLAGKSRLVCWDEGQEIRRGDKTKKGESAYLIARKAQFRVTLTATPIMNMGGELHNVMQITRPDALGTRSEFVREWCVGDSDNPGKIKIKDPKAMGTYLRDAGLMLRRTRQDVGRELPQLTRVPHEIDCDTAALKKIEGRATALAKFILSANTKSRGDQYKAAEMELNNLVRQATGIGKAPYCAEFIRMLAESGERVLVGVWHREVYSVLMQQLSDEKIGDGNLHPVMYSGSETPAEKEKSKESFCSGQARVMLISLRSGVGLDGLQHHCRTGVVAELDWSPEFLKQLEGRIHRDGQPDRVLWYYLTATEGSDPPMLELLGIKQMQADGIKDPKGAFVHGLDADGVNVRRLAEAYLNRRKLAG